MTTKEEQQSAYNEYIKERLDQTVAYAEYLADSVNQLYKREGKQPIVKSQTKTKSIWSRLRLEARISIIIGISSLILSFLTLITK